LAILATQKDGPSPADYLIWINPEPADRHLLGLCCLQSEHERYLTEKFVKKPIVVMHYPKDIKAFYMRVNDDGKTVAAMDVLAPGIGEIIGGSQREERLDMLDARMTQLGIDREHYGWYRDLRRYGTVPQDLHHLVAHELRW